MRMGKILLLCCCLLLGGIGNLLASDATPAAKPLTVGLMPYLSTRTLLANYQPIALALEQSLKQPVLLLTAPDFDTFVRRVFDGEYDIVLLAPHYARLATKEYGYNALLQHKAPIRGVLISGRNAPLKSFDDLRGQIISVVDRSALIAVAGVLTLADAGLREGSDYRFVESVSHSSALHNTVSGRSRAALVSHSTLILAPEELQREAVVWREIATVPGQLYIAHNRVPTTRQQAVKAALLAFEKTTDGQRFFEKTNHGGFREPNNQDNALLDRLLPETRRHLGNIAH